VSARKVRFDAFQHAEAVSVVEGWTRDAERVVLLHYISEHGDKKDFLAHLRDFAKGRRKAAGVPLRKPKAGKLVQDSEPQPTTEE